MINFFKKYWSHFLGIIFFSFLLFVFNYESLINDNFILGISLVVVVLALVAAAWFEIIYGMIKCCTNKEDNHKVLHCLMIYFLSLIYFPCYYLKYICKDKDYYQKNALYVIITVILYIMLFVIIFNR